MALDTSTSRRTAGFKETYSVSQDAAPNPKPTVNSSKELQRLLAPTRGSLRATLQPIPDEVRASAAAVINVFPDLNPFTMVPCAWMKRLLQKLVLHGVPEEHIVGVCVELYPIKAEKSSQKITPWWNYWRDILLEDRPDCLDRCLQRFRVEYNGPQYKVARNQYLTSGLNRSGNHTRDDNWYNELKSLITDMLEDRPAAESLPTNLEDRHIFHEHSLSEKGYYMVLAIPSSETFVKATQSRALISAADAKREDECFFDRIKADLELVGFLNQPREGFTQSHEVENAPYSHISDFNSSSPDEPTRRWRRAKKTVKEEFYSTNSRLVPDQWRNTSDEAESEHVTLKSEPTEP